MFQSIIMIQNPMEEEEQEEPKEEPLQQQEEDFHHNKNSESRSASASASASSCTTRCMMDMTRRTRTRTTTTTTTTRRRIAQSRDSLVFMSSSSSYTPLHSFSVGSVRRLRVFSNDFLLLSLLLLLSSYCLSSCHGEQINMEYDYDFNSLEPCALSSFELSNLGVDDALEPCVLYDQPNEQTFNNSNDSNSNSNNDNNTTSSSSSSSSIQQQDDEESILTMIQVTPAFCRDHRDGTWTGIQQLNADNNGQGISIGYYANHTVKFRFVSIIAGNTFNLTSEDYEARHVQLLNSALSTLSPQFIVGTCSSYSALEQEPALEHETILMAQVGPPGFYKTNNPYVFGFHLDSDEYPRWAVQTLSLYSRQQQQQSQQQVASSRQPPVVVVYRSESEFFSSTCQAAVRYARNLGFHNVTEIVFHPNADDDENGIINSMDTKFLHQIADAACPYRSDTPKASSLPALFVCTLIEQDILYNRWRRNGCQPVVLWMTASVWSWATDNMDKVPYLQGSGQWHEAFDYSDQYFDSGKLLLEYNQEQFGYYGTYDTVVSYSIATLFASLIESIYRIVDTPNVLSTLSSRSGYEEMRRALMVLTADTLFGPFALNSYQRNVGRGAAGSQWLLYSSSSPLLSNNTNNVTNITDTNNINRSSIVENNDYDDSIISNNSTITTKTSSTTTTTTLILTNTTTNTTFNMTTAAPAPTPSSTDFINKCVSPLEQAEAIPLVPSLVAIPCNSGGQRLSLERLRTEEALLTNKCEPCPVDTYSPTKSRRNNDDDDDDDDIFLITNSNSRCEKCPEGSSTDGQMGATACVFQNANLVSGPVRAMGFSFAGAIWYCSMNLMLFVTKYRKAEVVREDGPLLFYILICLGTMISSASILAILFAEADVNQDTASATRSCRAIPFCYTIGWVLQFGTLSSKAYRRYRESQTSDESIIMTKYREYWVLLVALCCDVFIVFVWTVSFPFHYTRRSLGTRVNENGFYTIETTGECSIADSDVSVWAFVGPLLFLHITLMGITNFMLWRGGAAAADPSTATTTSAIATKSSELAVKYRTRRYTVLISICTSEILVIGIPMVLAVMNNNTARFAVLAVMVFLENLCILVFVFVPKWHLIMDYDEDKETKNNDEDDHDTKKDVEYHDDDDDGKKTVWDDSDNILHKDESEGRSSYNTNPNCPI